MTINFLAKLRVLVVKEYFNIRLYHFCDLLSIIFYFLFAVSAPPNYLLVFIISNHLVKRVIFAL